MSRATESTASTSITMSTTRLPALRVFMRGILPESVSVDVSRGALRTLTRLPRPCCPKPYAVIAVDSVVVRMNWST
ncbi:hypothetical protein [Saccharomonospora sp.]|uniref:hypothetical protein n=1 Tax=Saccharomonospora sp. TaxID=33913 RepID=UPI002623905F|nr:hypothetical protein [Saccharomonospora sp.]